MHWVNYLAIVMHMAVVLGAVAYFVKYRDHHHGNATGAASVCVAFCASAAWLMVNTTALHLAALGKLTEPPYQEFWVMPAAFLGLASCVNIASHWLWGLDGREGRG